MEQREDYVESQIDILSKILRKLLEKLLKVKSDDTCESALNGILASQISTTSERLALKDLDNIPNEKLIETFLKEYNYDNRNIELLADVLYHLSKKGLVNFDAGKKALMLYNQYISNAKSNIDFIALKRKNELEK